MPALRGPLLREHQLAVVIGWMIEIARVRIVDGVTTALAEAGHLAGTAFAPWVDAIIEQLQTILRPT
jgi:hypothetical protein